ncbi:hypothetical protein DMUE_5678 [Dictyocoela muelleri]|nr:hypothetical protein DMUE_5678 [Dictyocoela muelleri]
MIMIDFEQATFNGIRTSFPNAQVKGCFLHFGQALWRRVQKLGLVRLFNNDARFMICVQLCSSLALIPLSEIDNAWVLISGLWPTEVPAAVALKQYMEHNWLFNNDNSLFSRNTWNHFGLTRGRTNNAAEGFHSKLIEKSTRITLVFGKLVRF